MGCVKLNLDVAVSAKVGLMGLGCVIRNHLGEVMDT